VQRSLCLWMGGTTYFRCLLPTGLRPVYKRSYLLNLNANRSLEACSASMGRMGRSASSRSRSLGEAACQIMSSIRPGSVWEASCSGAHCTARTTQLLRATAEYQLSSTSLRTQENYLSETSFFLAPGGTRPSVAQG
jgi:hypothetical protein